MADTFINLLFAGHDTTAHTIARLLAELPRHPDIWDRLSKEQTAVSTSHCNLSMTTISKCDRLAPP